MAIRYFCAICCEEALDTDSNGQLVCPDHPQAMIDSIVVDDEIEEE